MTGRLQTIKAVSLQTGIPAATLRKWEERYGLVKPVRLENGYRGYTDRDLAILRWVQAQVQAGALISVVAEEAAARLQAGWNPGAEAQAAAVALAPGALTAHRDRLLHHLLRSEEAAARRTLDELFALFPVEIVLLDVIEPVLHEIGHRWETGEISEYREHAASTMLRDRIAALRALHYQANGPHLVTGCVPGERHEIGSLMLGLLAMRRGFQVTHLGAAPSPEGLRRAVGELQPQAVCLSVSSAERLAEAVPSLGGLVEAAGRLAVVPRLFLGGQGAAAASEWPALAPFLAFTGRGDAALDLIATQLGRR